MRVPYTFSVLRYVHDPVTMEFVNVGVVVYAPQAAYLGAVTTERYGRLSKMFDGVDGGHFKEVSRYLQNRIREIGDHLRAGQLPFAAPGLKLEPILGQVLPPDDSAIQFSPPGAGVTADPPRVLDELYDRYVEQYSGRSSVYSRSDDDVWRVFREPLDKRLVTPRLKPKRIVAPDYEYEFQRARQNEIWHAYEPVSFDLVESTSILDKANTWRGRMATLAESPEPFQLHLLLGRPRQEKLLASFAKAQNILRKMPGRPPQLVQEEDAGAFAEALKREMEEHGG